MKKSKNRLGSVRQNIQKYQNWIKWKMIFFKKNFHYFFRVFWPFLAILAIFWKSWIPDQGELHNKFQKGAKKGLFLMFLKTRVFTLQGLFTDFFWPFALFLRKNDQKMTKNRVFWPIFNIFEHHNFKNRRKHY